MTWFHLSNGSRWLVAVIKYPDPKMKLWKEKGFVLTHGEARRSEEAWQEVAGHVSPAESP